MRIHWLVAALLVVGWALSIQCAKNYTISPGTTTDLVGLMNGLEPGDVVTIESGNYTLSPALVTLNGKIDSPIIIQGQNEQNKPMFLSPTSSDQNVFNLIGSNWVLRNIAIIHIDENTVKVVDCLAVGSDNPNSSVVENAVIKNVLVSGMKGNGMKILRGRNLTIVGNEVLPTSASRFPNAFTILSVNDSTISNTLIHGQINAGFSIQPSTNLVIRDNICWGARDSCFRCREGTSTNLTITGNVIFNQGTTGPPIRADTNGGLIANNIIISPSLTAMTLFTTAPSFPPALLRLVHNTVYSTNPCLTIGNQTSLIVANNAFYCNGFVVGTPNTDGIFFYNNSYSGNSTSLPSFISSGILNQSLDTSNFENVTTNNFYPVYNFNATSNALVLSGNPNYSVSYDFNNVARNTIAPTVGAYEFIYPSNPAPNPTDSFKSLSLNLTSTNSTRLAFYYNCGGPKLVLGSDPVQCNDAVSFTGAQVNIIGDLILSVQSRTFLAAAQSVNVEGCATFGGSLQIQVPNITQTNQTVVPFSYDCYNGSTFSDIRILSDGSSGCNTKSSSTYGPRSLSVLFYSECSSNSGGGGPGNNDNTTKIVVGVVVGVVGLCCIGIIIIAIIGAVVVQKSRRRDSIRNVNV